MDQPQGEQVKSTNPTVRLIARIGTAEEPDIMSLTSMVNASTFPPSDPVGMDVSSWTNRKATAQARRAAEARQISGRRTKIDPTTCERDYTPEEVEFMKAMQEYKQRSGRMFPTWSEVLEVLVELGYRKDDPSTTKT